MKKRIITLCVSIGMVGLLLATYFIVNNLERKEESETTSAPVSTYTVAEIDRSSLYAFGYTYNGKSYDLTLKDDCTGWTLKSNEELPISNTVVAYMVKQFEFMTSDFKIENVTEEKLADYGFDSPSAEMYFYDSEGRHAFEVGILNTFNSMYYIRSTNAKSTVYLVPKDFMDYYILDEMGLIQVHEVLSASLTEEIRIEINAGDDKLVYKYYPSGKSGVLMQDCSWFISINGNDEFPVNEKIAEKLSESCGYLGFAECISYSKDDIEKYGLSDAVKITLEYTNITSTIDSETSEAVTIETEQSHIFLLGDTDDNGYSYAMTEDEPLIYVTVSDIYSLLFGFDADDVTSICTAYAVNADNNEITSVKFGYGSQLYVLEASESATGIDYYLNDKKISKDDAEAVIKLLSVVTWYTDSSKESPTTDIKELLSVELSDGTDTFMYTVHSFSEGFYLFKTVFSDSLLVSAEAVQPILDAIQAITE